MGERLHFDVLVIGSGASGLAAGLTAERAGVAVGLATKGALQSCNSAKAQGGIQAAVGEDDSPELHAEDVWRSSHETAERRLVEVLIPYLVKNELGGGADDLGLVFAAGGVGAIIASIAFAQHGFPRRHMTFMYVSWSLGGLTIALYGVATSLWQAMVVSFVEGACFAVGMIVWGTMLHRLVPSELLGRVEGFDWLVSVALVPVSFALTGPVAEVLGTNETLIGAGIVGGVGTFAFLFLPGMRDTERDQELAFGLRIREANQTN